MYSQYGKLEYSQLTAPRRFKFFFDFLYPAFRTFPAGSGVLLFDEMDACGIWANCLSREGKMMDFGWFQKARKRFKDGARGTSGQTQFV